MQRLRRAVVIVLLGLMLAAPWASAAESSSRAAREKAAPSLLHSFWSFLAGVWSAAGCHIDPLGGCSAGEEPRAPETDAGCRLDTLGCPLPPAADEGCRIDPWGCPAGQ